MLLPTLVSPFTKLHELENIQRVFNTYKESEKDTLYLFADDVAKLVRMSLYL